MATIMCLPNEVIEIILGYRDITIEDIINFRCVCKQFRWAAKYEKHLEKKFSQRWSVAKKLYDKQSKENEQKKSEENKQKDKEITFYKNLNFIETGINCARQLRSYVSQIIHKHYYESIDNVKKFECIFRLDIQLKNIFEEINKPENFVAYYFFIDEIRNLLTQSPRITGCDLTERYCNIKILHYMRQCSLKKKWDKYKEKPDREQLLERTATIIAQWIKPEKEVFYSYVKASLDSMALEVLNCLREKHPDHSIFSTSAETFLYWKNNNIDDNHWNEAEGTQIMDTLQEYIFGKLIFRPSSSEDTNLKNLCIDNVLENKCGQEIIIYIIYHSVARRLGLRCDIVNLRIPVLPLYSIFWKPKYATNSLENARCFNIISNKFPDCLVKQLSLLKTLYSSDRSEDVFAISATEMWYEMREILAFLTNQYNTPIGINPRKYGYDVINHKLIVSLHIQRTENLNARSKDVKFAVGMIVTHQLTDSCAGVIVGWHRYVDRHVTFSINSVWDPQMDVCIMPLNHCRNFNFTNQQTNYIILTENNEMCYVEEDAITLTTPKWIDNSEIGRYFCKFEDTHYVPNKMLARLYPQDAVITAQTKISKN